MRYFIDTEFIERGDGKPIDLVSVGVVSEDGREFYAVSTEFKERHASQWVKDNVLRHLPERRPTPPPYGSPRAWHESFAWMDRAAIRDMLIAFVGDDRPEFWGWCCGFDYVVVCQLVGFDRWPPSWGYYFRDIQQEADRLGVDLHDIGATDNHHALADARRIRDLWSRLQQSVLPLAV
jgi:hypothetical protein